MSEKKSWSVSNTLSVIAMVVSILIAIFGGSWYYNEVFKSKELVYSVLPGYDMGDQYFTGVVVENRGKVTLTDVEVILSDLEAEIMKLNIPGPVQKYDIVKGGENSKELYLAMPKLSQQGSITIYLL